MQSNSLYIPSPIEMLYAFSCELYLKALIKFCDRNEKAYGHELKSLFHHIKCQEIKQTIKNAYIETFGNGKKADPKLFPIGFENTLAKFNTAFEYLRYENEYIETWKDSAFLPWFCDTLHKVCEEKELYNFGIDLIE